MRLLCINDQGGGFAGYVNVDEDVSVAKYFAQRMPGQRAEDYLIRVNRQPVPADPMLRDDNRIINTSTRIEGASASVADRYNKATPFLSHARSCGESTMPEAILHSHCYRAARRLLEQLGQRL